MGNRALKLQLYKADPRCHWCGRETILTNIQHLKGTPDPLMATVDHVIPRLDPRRWVVQKPGEIRKVLACFECNSKRSHQDCLSFSAEERKRRGTGFALNKGPDGKPILTKPLESLEAVLDIFAKNGIVLNDETRKSECGTVAERRELSEVHASTSH